VAGAPVAGGKLASAKGCFRVCIIYKISSVSPGFAPSGPLSYTELGGLWSVWGATSFDRITYVHYKESDVNYWGMLICIFAAILMMWLPLKAHLQRQKLAMIGKCSNCGYDMRVTPSRVRNVEPPLQATIPRRPAVASASLQVALKHADRLVRHHPRSRRSFRRPSPLRH
jgi:hypothetical protein